MKSAIRLLASLYFNALSLGKGDLSSDIDAEKLTADKWRAIYQRSGALPFNSYQVVPSPFKLDQEEPVTGERKEN